MPVKKASGKFFFQRFVIPTIGGILFKAISVLVFDEDLSHSVEMTELREQ